MRKKRLTGPIGFLMIMILFAAAVLPVTSRAEGKNGDNVVRVLLTRLKLTDRVDVSLDGSYTLNGLSFQRGSRLVVSSASGHIVAYYEGMAVDCGDSLLLVRHRLPDEAAGLENGLRLNGEYYLHPGDLSLTLKDGQLRAVLHAPVEEYLWGVVPYEMSDAYPTEALKVQAICSRTYVLNKKAASDSDYDVVDNTNDQAYYGIQPQNTRSLEAIRSTEGICGYDNGGRLIQCYYSASNGGQTECASHVWGGSDQDYLPVRPDPYDLANPAGTVRSFRLGKTASLGFGALETVLTDAVRVSFDSFDADIGAEDLAILSCTPADAMYPGSMISTNLQFRVSVTYEGLISDDGEEEVYFDGAAPQGGSSVATRTVSVKIPVFPTIESLCQLDINMGSNNEIVTVRETEDAFWIEARRFGHGVGMSQRGAQWMAQEYGMSCESILAFYYPGVSFRRSTFSAYVLPSPLSAVFLATPGPAATPTPRPTLMPVEKTSSRALYLAAVTNIGENSYLNLRSAPSMNAPVLRQLYFGQVLCVLEETGDGWLHVCTDDAEGYVSAAFVDTAGPQ
ncbi:MAG: SpoIID/LytB domain-containing protein [Clostridia bacterium]|nr:SpoIID/LytB domain-containing protein [Clostridia bacterium]